MVNTYLAFNSKASYHGHPEVMYFGAIKGDSKEQWERRFAVAHIQAVFNSRRVMHGII
jgi:hypothetical protein